MRPVPTQTHGRILVREPIQAHSLPVLVGFHGYAESAEAQMDRLASIPGADRWLLVSIQGLNRFYRGRSEDVVYAERQAASRGTPAGENRS